MVASTFVLLAVLVGVLSPALACPAELEVYLGTCSALLQVDLNNGNIPGLCPEFYRTQDCIWFYLSQCNSTVQLHWNASFAAINQYLDTACASYQPPSSGWPTQSPVCNMTEIYLESLACIGNLQAESKKIKYSWELSPFCKKYRSAWACAMGWIQPCPYAVDYFNQSMTDVRVQMQPYCGSPDGSAGLFSSMLVVIFSLFALWIT